MAEILLVTGSRSLARSPAAARWSRAAILRALADSLEHTNTVRVVTGDAEGPDDWAGGIAYALNDIPGLEGVATSEFQLNGRLIHSDADSWWTTETPPAKGTTAYRRWPLYRNATMVAWVTERALAGDVVRVLGLVDPASTTRGTDHTLGLARRAGLPVTRLEWRS